MSIPSTELSDFERHQGRGDQVNPAGLKPIGLRIPTLADRLDIGLTKAWELCGPAGPIETVKIDGCTIAIYESVERYIENLRRQKADQPQSARKGLQQATTASLAARSKRRRGRGGGEAAVRDGASSAAQEAPVSQTARSSQAADKRTGKPGRQRDEAGAS